MYQKIVLELILKLNNIVVLLIRDCRVKAIAQVQRAKGKSIILCENEIVFLSFQQSRLLV